MKKNLQIQCLAVAGSIFWINSIYALSVSPTQNQSRNLAESISGKGRPEKKIGMVAYEKTDDEGDDDDITEDNADDVPFTDPILLDHTKAIVIIGKPDALHKDEYKGLQGVYIYEVDLPGQEKGLTKQIQKYIGKPLTSEDVTAIKTIIVQYYKSYGRPIISIQVPEQEVTEGVIQFLLIEGVLGKVESKGNKYFKSARLENFIRLKPGESINETTLVKNLNFMNLNPFRRTDAIYNPGEKPGTTDIELLTKDRRPLRLYLGVDNTGLERTGETRWYGGFNWGNAFGLDQQLSYQYTTASDFSKFQAHTINYTIPLPWQHMVTLYGGYSSIHAALPFPVVNSHGHAYQGSLRYDIPLNPIGRYLHEVIWGGDFKRTNNTLEYQDQYEKIIPTNVNLTQLAFGYNGGLQTNQSKTFVEGEILYSPGQWIPDQTEMVYHELRPGAKPTYAYFRGSLIYIQTLPKNFAISGLFRGQIATTNLLPSEQFGLGGYNTVRGYEERQVNSDNAVLLSSEFRSPVIGLFQYFGSMSVKDGLQFLAFVDYGFGKDYKSLPDTPDFQWLMGIGPGLRYTIDPYLSIRLDYGFKVHKHNYEGGAGRFHFAVIASY